MSSVVDICNLALGRLGLKAFISSLDEATAEAEVCNRFFNATRDAALASAPWPFAKKRATLALLSGVTRAGWAFCYAKPSDCLSPRFVWNGLRNPRPDQLIPFELELGDADGSHIICTDHPGAELVFTKRVDNPTLFHPLFVNALAWRLASELAAPLSGKPDLAKAAWAAWLSTKSEAHAATLNEAHEPVAESVFITERA